MENPLLAIPGHTNKSFVPFDKIKDEHFEPAFAMVLEVARKNLKTIIETTESPTFENTIEAFERVAPELGYVTAVFNCLKEAHTNKEKERIAEIILPQLAEFSNDVFLNERLFTRVKEVHDAELSPKTTEEEKRLLQITYRSFVRNGALLSGDDKAALRTIDKEMTLLSQQFSKNLLGATNEYQLIITDQKDLAGLPKRVIETARAEAGNRGVDGWVFTLHMPSFGPFMQYAESEQLRKKLSLAFKSRGMGGQFDNREIVVKMVILRDRRAKLLGYKNHAHYVLEERMVKNPETIEEFFKALYAPVHRAATMDYQTLVEFKKNIHPDTPLQQWDVAYLIEKLQWEKFQYDEEAIRPYLSMEDVVDGVRKHAHLLYGVNFKKRTDAPVYHPDVVVYELSDQQGKYLGMLYLDFYPRESKRGGAWADMFLSQHKENGADIRPHVALVMNFTKPTDTKPSLLSISEVETLFHEFGHALHCFFSECTYQSLAGYNGLLDFVELPSQLMENWASEKGGLRLFAKHFETKEEIPDDLVESIVLSKNFFAGWGVLSQLAAAVLDFQWHTIDPKTIDSIEDFEKKVFEKFSFFDRPQGTSQSTNFKHIFGGGYDVGYYSYHWSKVLAADAFEYFKEKGIFSREVADKFREYVLSKGNTEEPMELYKKFRGREPDPNALLRSKGLL